MALSHFDERSGVISSDTPWGKWWQTVSEVFIEVNIPEGTPGRDCKVLIKPNYIECSIRNKELFKGSLFNLVKPEECTWTVEERKKIMILLEKAEKFEKENSWVSLLKEQYVANPYIQLEMKKKLDLEKFQIENPGFDFSGAQLSKSYENPPYIPENENS